MYSSITSSYHPRPSFIVCVYYFIIKQNKNEYENDLAAILDLSNQISSLTYILASYMVNNDIWTMQIIICATKNG